MNIEINRVNRIAFSCVIHIYSVLRTSFNDQLNSDDDFRVSE